MTPGCEEEMDPGRRDEVGRMLQATLWSQLVLDVGDVERGMARAEPGQAGTFTETQGHTLHSEQVLNYQQAPCSALLTKDKVAV